MSAFDNIIIQGVSGNIVNEYSDIVVDLLTAKINDNTVLTPTQKTDAVTQLVDNAPKYQVQFKKMVELIIAESYTSIKDQIHNRCYVIMPKVSSGSVNMVDIDILQNNGTYYHQIKANKVSGYITGRILFTNNNI